MKAYRQASTINLHIKSFQIEFLSASLYYIDKSTRHASDSSGPGRVFFFSTTNPTGEFIQELKVLLQEYPFIF